MNHTEAVYTSAVERYMLGQMSSSESGEFEKHFFSCLDCARELLTWVIFENNIRAVLEQGSEMAQLDRALGHALLEIRENRGISQEELAEESNYHLNFIRLLERGMQHATIRTLVKVSKALGVAPSTVVRRMETILAKGDNRLG
jgi:hypothetical protein